MNCSEYRQEQGQDGYQGNPMASNWEKKSVKFRCFIYDVTQHIAFKRASAILVVANCGLLFFPVSLRWLLMCLVEQRCGMVLHHGVSHAGWVEEGIHSGF